MAHGGGRKGAGRHSRSCDCERCQQKHGSRPTDGNLARKIKAKIDAEKRWLEIVAIELKLMREENRTDAIKRTLMYLDDRDFGPRTQKLELDGKLQLDLAARRDRVRELLSRLAGGTKR